MTRSPATPSAADETVLRDLLARAGEEPWRGADLDDVLARGRQHRRAGRSARAAVAGLVAVAAGGALLAGRAAGPERTVIPAAGGGPATGGVGGLFPALPVATIALVLLVLAAIAAGLLVRLIALRAGRPLQRWPGRLLVAGQVTAVAVVGWQGALAIGYMPSESMEPTLQVGSRYVVAPRIPGLTAVHRGDVVVLHPPTGWLPPSIDGSRTTLVERVIGLPGETVACCDTQGRITVNGAPLDEPYINPQDAPSDEVFTWKVRPGAVFVMGDHRRISADSRFHFDGTPDIPLQDITGVIVGPLRWPGTR